MAQLPNPPQFEKEYDVYKLRQFVEEMVRTLTQLNDEVAAGGGGGGGGDGYPAQLGHFGCR
jgi:hypothetical protein